MAADAPPVVHRFITFLETGEAPAGLFAETVFCDATFPEWRLQASGRDDVIAIRTTGHPARGRVPRYRYDATPTGFVLEVEERWTDVSDTWYCREIARADLDEAGEIAELSIYCTGDWSSARVAEHAATVSLIRP